MDSAGVRELRKSLFFCWGKKLEYGGWGMEYGGVPCFFCARKRILGMVKYLWCTLLFVGVLRVLFSVCMLKLSVSPFSGQAGQLVSDLGLPGTATTA